MKAIIVVLAVFIVCFIFMLIATHNAMPYDPSWDEEMRNHYDDTDNQN